MNPEAPPPRPRCCKVALILPGCLYGDGSQIWDGWVEISLVTELGFPFLVPE